MVTGAGLIGEYHKNDMSFKNYVPDYVVPGEQISFNTWRVDDKKLFRHVRWMGYISFPYTTTFDVDMTGIDGKCKLWIGDKVVLDADEESSIGSFRAYEHVLYEIQIEYSMVRDRVFPSCLIYLSLHKSNLTWPHSYLKGYRSTNAAAILVITTDEKRSYSKAAFV